MPIWPPLMAFCEKVFKSLAFESHPKFIDLLVSLMKSKPVSEELKIEPFTLQAWWKLALK